MCQQFIDGVDVGTYEIPLIPGETTRGAITRKWRAAQDAGWVVLARTQTMADVQKNYPPAPNGYQVKRRIFTIV